MSGSKKRAPTTELNHDNWNDEVVPEKAGEFKKADEEQLKGRKILKAKRMYPTEDEETSTVPKSAGFAGFNFNLIPATTTTTATTTNVAATPNTTTTTELSLPDYDSNSDPESSPSKSSIESPTKMADILEEKSSNEGPCDTSADQKAPEEIEQNKFSEVEEHEDQDEEISSSLSANGGGNKVEVETIEENRNGISTSTSHENGCKDAEAPTSSNDCYEGEKINNLAENIQDKE